MSNINLLGRQQTEQLWSDDGTDLTPLTSTRNIVTSGNIEAINTKMTAWKSHRVATVTFGAVSTWTDIEFDLKIADECLAGISYYDEGGASEDTSILVITGFNDIITIGGCLHTNWTGSAGADCLVAGRVVYSTDSGSTWTEARCLQTLDKEARGINADGTQTYVGSIKVDGETWVKLQVQVSDTDMELKGDSTIFDNPVAATIWMANIGNNAQTT